MSDVEGNVKLRHADAGGLEMSTDGGVTWSPTAVIPPAAIPTSALPRTSGLSVLGGVQWKGIGDSLSGPTLNQNIWRDLHSFLMRDLSASGVPQPTSITFTGVGGQKSDAFLAGVNAQAIAGTADGDVFFLASGVNDILGTPPNPTADQMASNLDATLAAITAARPNSPIIVAPILFPGTEAWSVTSAGVAQGVGANDADARYRNTRMATICAKYTQVTFLASTYGDTYAYAAAANTGNLASLFMTLDTIHPGDLGRKVFGQSALRQIRAGLRNVLPPNVLPSARHDASYGRWMDEVREFVESIRAGGAGAFNIGTRMTEWIRIPVGELPASGTYPAGVSNANVLGGGLALAPAAPLVLSSALVPDAQINPFIFAWRGSFNAQAGGRDALFGLVDNTTGANLIAFGISNAASATKWVSRERAATVNNHQVSAINSDTNRHTFIFMFDGKFNTGSTLIYDVFVDFTQVLHVNPTASFPTAVNLAMGMPAIATGGIVTVEDACFGFNRVRTA